MSRTGQQSGVSVALTLHAFAREFEATLAGVLDLNTTPDLLQAMQYAVMGKGKRFRPFLVAVCGELFHVAAPQTQAIAVAVELMHSASLVLDDLPAMDAAETRRSLPALHRRFGDSTAILVAMSLVLKAFEVLSDSGLTTDAAASLALVQRFAECCGVCGLTGGQFSDLKQGAEGHALKTASLMGFCCEAPAIAAGADDVIAERMRQLGECLGRLFQIRDDELDSGVPAPGKWAEVEAANRLIGSLAADEDGAMATALPDLPVWIAERTS